MAISRTQTVEVELPIAETYKRCLHAADALHRASLKEAKEDAGMITLKVPVSVKSWGERVVLQLHEDGPSSTSVEVTSRPAVGMTRADYGKNARNVQEVVDWLAGLSSTNGDK